MERGAFRGDQEAAAQAGRARSRGGRRRKAQGKASSHHSFACRNPEQAAGDAAKPAEILEKLEVRLGSEGPGGLVVDRGL